MTDRPPRSRRGRKVWLSVAAALTVLAGLVATVGPPAGAQVAPSSAADDAYTFTSWDFGFGDPTDVFDGERRPVLRMDLDWWTVQGCRDCVLNWNKLDPAVDAAQDKGMRILLILSYAPPWANGGHENDKWFPTNDADWVAIVDATVRHFGAKVQAYEVWNEPNLAQFGNYGTGTDEERKARYWQLVALAHGRVKAGCPQCVVLAGGSAAGSRPANQPETPGRNDNESARWLEWGYQHGHGGDFDAVAHHPYPAWNSGKGPADAECDYYYWNQFGPPFYTDSKTGKTCGGELAAVRKVMLEHQDGAKKIWGTEWGYPTSGVGNQPSIEVIRDYAVQGVHMWRALDYTGPLFLYRYRDLAVYEGQPCLATEPECHFGVVKVDGTRKEPLYTDLKTKVYDTWPASLSSGQSLRRLAALRSPDGRFYLWMQGDGNLVLYQAGKATALWASNTTTGVSLANQTDGNLVISDAQGSPLVHSNTWTAHASTLRLQNDGNLVLYRNSDGKPVWDRFTNLLPA